MKDDNTPLEGQIGMSKSSKAPMKSFANGKQKGYLQKNFRKKVKK